jgi:hypothetical protein
MSAATVHKLHVGVEPDQSERAEALAKAKETITGAKADLLAAASMTHRVEDPVRRWAREGKAREDRMQRGAQLKYKLQEQRQQQGSGGDWATWVAGEIRAAVQSEREFMREVIGGVIAQERERVRDELETKVKALEAANAELRGLLLEKVGGVAERAGRSQLELGGRLATCERAMIGFKAQTDAIEQTFNDVRAYYRKLYGE